MNNEIRKTILLVEDEPHIAKAEAKIIKNFGYEVVISYTGEDAIKRFRMDYSIDLILMDIELGIGIDGTETARRILKHRNVPIVFLTSHTEKEYVNKAKKLNRYGYIIKNSGDFVLQSSIEMAFELFEAKRIISIKHDILRKAEERERERIRELEAVLDAVPAIVWIAHDPECKIVTGNRLASELLRMPSDSNQSKTAPTNELTRHFKIFKDGKEITSEQLPVQLAAKGTVVKDFEIDIIFDDGASYHLTGNANPLVDNNGRIYGSVASFNDVSGHKKSEENLRVSNEKFSKAFYSSPNPASISYLKTGQFIDVNDSFLNMLGFSRNELLGKTINKLEILSKNYRDELVQIISEKGYLRDLEVKLRKKTGEYIWALISVELIELEGEVCNFIICKDITEQKQNEKTLLEREKLYREILNTTMDAFWRVDMKGNILEVNPAWSRLSGYAAEEIMKKSIPDFEVIESQEDTLSHIEKMKREGGDRFESKHRRKDGRIIDVEVSTIYSELNGGQIFGFFRDITEKNSSQKKLIEQLDELQHWHNVTLGREERIIELKREVNQLLLKLGEPERYNNQDRDLYDSLK